MPPAPDAELLQIVNASLTDATRRAQKADGSSWLACRPGCTSCCHGVFRISQLDADRLHTALKELSTLDPLRAEAILLRAQSMVDVLSISFPGDAASGILGSEDEAWEHFADLPETDIACPVLDPSTGRCELYAARPLTCRIFGPPVQNEEGIGMCELCYVGASEVEILHGEMHLVHHPLEDELTSAYPPGETIIAWALRSSHTPSLFPVARPML